MVRERWLTPLDVYARTLKGPRIDEKKYDLRIIPEITKKYVNEYKIEIPRDVIIPDGDVADRLFEAGWNLLLENGLYCMDKERIVKVTEDEIRDGIKQCPKELVLGGPGGKDVANMVQRRIGGENYNRKMIIQGGPTGAPVSEDIFIKMMQSYAQESVVDALVNGVLNTIEGEPVIPKSPREIKAVKTEQAYVRMACQLAGRPGMGI